MLACRLDPLATLRRHRLLRTWLVALMLATGLTGLHAAWHAATTLSSQVAASAPAPGSDDGPHDADCAACRLAAGLAITLWAPGLLFVCATTRMPARRTGTTVPRTDAATRWHQRLKHGPPALLP